MKRFLTAACFVLCFLTGFAQDKYSSTHRKAIEYYERAGVYVDQRLYNGAIKEINTALTFDPNFWEARHLLGDIYREQGKYEEAKAEYLKIAAVNPLFSKQLPFALGESYFNTGEYPEAKAQFEQYLSQDNIAPARKQQAERFIINSDFAAEAIKNPVLYNPLNLGKGVNTADQEYLPNVTADDSTLIFTRKGRTGEDFYISYLTEQGWSMATGLSNKINTPGNEGAQCISPDGQYLFFAGCNRKDGMGKCDIYYSRLVGKEWSAPQNLGPPVNTPAWESQPALSADGKTLYFVSDRKGGLGSYDIWQSTYAGDGKWSAPVNLGPTINTPYEEMSPFIHSDNQTLYFSSDGWPGFGNRDIFYSRKGKDGRWQEPENIGYPINTYKEESSLFLNTDGKKGYFASNNLEGMGGMDIYTFEIPEKARPRFVTYVKGIVKDKFSTQPLQANFEIIDVATGDTLVSSNSNLATGQFLATLPAGKTYGLNVNKEGYLFYSDNFSLSYKQYKEPFQLDVPLQRIQVGSKIALRNIFFETGSFKLKNESKYELTKLVQFMKSNPTVILEVGGHTDNVGDDKTNMTLSNNRAKTVYDYLVKLGIAPERLKYKGYGETSPVESNTTENGRANNRRTEVKILGN
jgi:outer membrane protein OmpA-like peptidoglycan-associated protein